LHWLRRRYAFIFFLTETVVASLKFFIDITLSDFEATE